MSVFCLENRFHLVDTGNMHVLMYIVSVTSLWKRPDFLACPEAVARQIALHVIVMHLFNWLIPCYQPFIYHKCNNNSNINGL